MRRFSFPLFAMIVLLFTACGSESGGDVDLPPQTPAGTALGSRAVPGYRLHVHCDADPLPAAQRSLTLNLEAEDGQAAPILVEFALGSNQPGTWLAGTPSNQHLRWAWTLTLPADLRDQRVWVRITDPDGNISHSGWDDFAFTP